MTHYFRSNILLASLIDEAFSKDTNPSMRKIRIKQLKQEEDKQSRINAVDFLNLMFGASPEFTAFWEIVQHKVGESYEFTMKEPEDYPHGYLLRTVLYHCGINIHLTDKMHLFLFQSFC